MKSKESRKFLDVICSLYAKWLGLVWSVLQFDSDKTLEKASSARPRLASIVTHFLGAVVAYIVNIDLVVPPLLVECREFRFIAYHKINLWPRPKTLKKISKLFSFALTQVPIFMAFFQAFNQCLAMQKEEKKSL